MRLTCPDCKSAVLLDDADAGREVECPRCRGTLRVPELPESDRPSRLADFAGSLPWQGKGVTSLVLGIVSIPGVVCCGIGGLFGLVGLVMGALSLRTPTRASAITGLYFSIIGVLLSLGLLVVFATVQSALKRPVVPAIDGVLAPFAQDF